MNDGGLVSQLAVVVDVDGHLGEDGLVAIIPCLTRLRVYLFGAPFFVVLISASLAYIYHLTYCVCLCVLCMFFF